MWPASKHLKQARAAEHALFFASASASRKEEKSVSACAALHIAHLPAAGAVFPTLGLPLPVADVAAIFALTM